MDEKFRVGTASLLAEWFPTIAELSDRDQNAILQMLTTFSTVISLASSRHGRAHILETGSGFSTEIFSQLISGHKDSNLISIDLSSEVALSENSRGNLKTESLAKHANLTLVSKPSVGLAEVESAWGLRTPLWNPLAIAARDIEFVLDYSFDARRLASVENLISAELTAESLLPEIHKISTGEGDVFNLWRYHGDDFDVLNSCEEDPVLEQLLVETLPNIVFLDSGEFSTLAEFLIVDRKSPPGTLLVVQDILFPKSLKGFLIVAIVSQSSRWKIQWLDRSTAQGMLVAERLS